MTKFRFPAHAGQSRRVLRDHLTSLGRLPVEPIDGIFADHLEQRLRSIVTVGVAPLSAPPPVRRIRFRGPVAALSAAVFVATAAAASVLVPAMRHRIFPSSKPAPLNATRPKTTVAATPNTTTTARATTAAATPTATNAPIAQTTSSTTAEVATFVPAATIDLGPDPTTTPTSIFSSTTRGEDRLDVPVVAMRCVVAQAMVTCTWDVVAIAIFASAASSELHYRVLRGETGTLIGRVFTPRVRPDAIVDDLVVVGHPYTYRLQVLRADGRVVAQSGGTEVICCAN